MDDTTTSFFPRHEVHVGRDLGGRTTSIHDADVAHYEAATGGPTPRLPLPLTLNAPALLYHSEVYRSLAWYLPNIFGNLHARQEWQFFAPLTIDGTVRTRSTVVERYLKRGREYVVNEVLVTDEAGRWLQRSRTHQSFLIEEERRGLVVDRDREKRSDRQFAIGEGPGDALPPLTRPITIAMCEAFSGPEKNYHTDRAAAQMLGFPDIVVQGMLSVCFISELMTQAYGLAWQLGGTLDLRLVNVVWVNDTLTAHGKIREEVAEGAKRRLYLDVWCEKPDGTKATVGTASVLQ
jgi:acyl dehydratase